MNNLMTDSEGMAWDRNLWGVEFTRGLPGDKPRLGHYAVFRLNMIRLAPETPHSEIDRIFNGETNDRKRIEKDA